MLETIKQQIQQEADALEAQLWETALFIHEHPELGLEEFQSSAKLTALLEAHGFAVERGIAGLETAFRATYILGGNSSPTIAFLAEYDALRGLGHACGHNLIGTISVGAAIALSKIQTGLAGRIVVLGTPAEEGMGAKISMVNQGIFRDIDVAMMVHPATRDAEYRRNLAALNVQVEFFGKAAHAASHPDEGINALDAMIVLFASVGLLRQQLASDVRLHGIITHGGQAANIIPDYAEAQWLVRASELPRAYETLKRFEQCVHAAAAATGATEKITYDLATMYHPILANDALIELYAANLRRLGIELEKQPAGKFGGSTDIGNVSQVVPAIHSSLNIISDGREINIHTPEFAEAAKSEHAKPAMMRGVKTLAMCGADLLGNPASFAAVQADFRQHKAAQ